MCDMNAVTYQNLPSSVWADSAPLGQMCKADFWAAGETAAPSGATTREWWGFALKVNRSPALTVSQI